MPSCGFPLPIRQVRNERVAIGNLYLALISPRAAVSLPLRTLGSSPDKELTMERQKALIASAVIAVTLTAGAVGVFAGSGLLDARTDNVGKLQSTTTQPTQVTVYVDPTTGAVSSTPPQPAAESSLQTTASSTQQQAEPTPQATEPTPQATVADVSSNEGDGEHRGGGNDD